MTKRGRTPLQHPELELPEVRKLWQTEGLFSEHYLKSRIQNNDWWPSDDAVRPLWQFCVELFNRRYVPCAQNNEAFTRQELINPILAKLDFAWTDNLSLPDQDAEPDYILFADAAEKEKVIAESREKRYRAASALLEAKKVNHPLSQISKHQQRYPHQQIRDYLQEAQVLGWGILTNGNEWRLYCRDAKPSHFFSVNFAIAIQSLENFKYFAALFGPAAFVRDAAGKCRLDTIRESALVAQIELEADLRQRVFTLVEILANGFVEHAGNAIPDNPEGLRLLYENCLILLYRLLFILYAEGRLLLPVEPKSRKYYKDLSLARLVGPLKGFTEFDSQTRTRLYEDIGELCHLINGTDEAKNKEYLVPRYNGGLFDPDRFPNLERWRICDANLAEVLRGLMFAKPDRHNRELPLETVDYADLRVQQLGSIYEGLLEHHFARNAAGRLELQTDKAERKATGTYYTPDYIVCYIVEHTLGPLVADIEQCPDVKQGKDNSFADAVLALNICDLAMGSGHFLVEATTWLAEQVVYHPTTRFHAEFQRGESQEQTEIAYWRRRVVEACIYGVDLNPLAVELAKLSLWLTTIATDQPLNFLDHHLRCGNSLIGARLDDLGGLPEKNGRARRPAEPSAPRQTTFTFGPDFKKAAASAIRQIQQIEGEASATVAKVKDKEKLWSEISQSLAPYKSVADLWTSTFFGQPLDEETYIATAQKILAGDAFDNPTAGPRHFFHWEIEFPEVFFAADGTPKPNPGFDAVIGNPPYDVVSEKEQQRDVESEKEFYEAQSVFDSAVGSKLNLYRLFVARAVRLLNQGAYHSFIVPMSLLADSQSKPLREDLLTHWQISVVEAFPQKDDPRNRVFSEAKLPTCVYVLRHAAPSQFVVRVHPGRDILADSALIELTVDEIRKFDPDNLSVPSHPKTTTASFHLALKLRAVSGDQLGRYAASQQGEVNLTTHADFLSDKPVGPVVLRGAHVGRYSLNDEPKQGEPKYLKVAEFLAAHGPDTKACAHRNVRIGYQRGAAIDNWRRIIATVIPAGHFCSDTVNYISEPTSLNLYAILALLNSSLWEWRFRLTSTNNHVNSYEIDSLPLPHFAFSTMTAERERLAKKGQDHYESARKKNEGAVALRFAVQQLAADHSDVVHDLLAFLAERMMELNREKQDCVRQFLTDLKDFQGIDAHALTPKTKLDQFWRLATSDLFAHLRANAKRLAEQGTRLKESDEDRLRQRFESAQEKIVPLETEIAFTDALIDQIVYRLYGLTEEEIRIVEGTGS